MVAKRYARVLTSLIILAVGLPLTLAQDGSITVSITSDIPTSTSTTSTITSAGEDLINRCQEQSPCGRDQECIYSAEMALDDCAYSVRASLASDSQFSCPETTADPNQPQTVETGPSPCVCYMQELVAEKCMCAYCNPVLVKSYFTLLASVCGTPTRALTATCATTTFPVFAPAEQTSDSTSVSLPPTTTASNSVSSGTPTETPAAGVRHMGLPVVWCVVPVLVDLVLNVF